MLCNIFVDMYEFIMVITLMFPCIHNAIIQGNKMSLLVHTEVLYVQELTNITGCLLHVICLTVKPSVNPQFYSSVMALVCTFIMWHLPCICQEGYV